MDTVTWVVDKWRSAGLRFGKEQDGNPVNCRAGATSDGSEKARASKRRANSRANRVGETAEEKLLC